MYYSDFRGKCMETTLFFPVNDPYDAAYRNNSPRDPVGPHSHNAVEIYLTLTDLPDILIENRVYEVPAGTLIIIPPFCVHQLYHEGGVKYERYVLSIKDSWIKNVFAGKPGLPECLYEKTEPFMTCLDGAAGTKQALTKDLNRLSGFSEKTSPEALAVLFSLLARICSLMKDHGIMENSVFVTESQKKINTVISYIQEHIREDLKIPDLAEHFHFNPDYLARLFKEHAHVSLGRYLNIQKISAAQELLRNGKTVTEVAEELGFSSYSYFFRCFQKTAGISPAKYREKYSG